MNCLYRLYYLTFLLNISGMHFSQAVAIIQAQVGVIKGVQVLYSDVVSRLQTRRCHF